MIKNIQRIIENLAKFTASPGEGVTRLTYTKEDALAREYIKNEMLDAGLQVHIDSMGNVWGKLEGLKAGPSVIVGSHFDSVYNAGAFDGIAGMVAGIEIARKFREEGIDPPLPYEAVALVEEEGSRFLSGTLASRVICGKVCPEEFEHLKDSQGISIAEAMAQYGFSHKNLDSAKRNPEDIKAFIELHIEQGPVLETSGIDIGIVETIVGIRTLSVTIEGSAGHAGTTPMNIRKDALVAASHAVIKAKELAETVSPSAVATVGKLNVYPNGNNVIPGKVMFTVDIRDKFNENIVHISDELSRYIKELCHENNMICTIKQVLHSEPVVMNETIRNGIKSGCEKENLSYTSILSGAGHDAMIFAEKIDTAMVFVPSKKGLSHHPDEWTDYKQIEKGINTIYHTVKEIMEVENAQ